MKNPIRVAAVLLAALLAAPAARAADEVITVGACQPITGRFAFAGVAINQGLQDYLTMANEKKLVPGKTFKYVYEDSGYDTDRAVACFKKMMAQHSPQIMYGESTGLGKAIAPELNSRYKVLYASASFSSELADPKTHPYSFISGPTYTDMFGVLLEYIARNKGAAKPRVVFFYSDTEFGKDPIAGAKKRAGELGIDVVGEIVTKAGAVDVTSEVLQLKKLNPDYVIFQGFVLAPIPEVIRATKDFGLKTKFMGTFWSMDKTIIDKLGQDADGYMGVMPYAYYYEESAPGVAAMRAYNQKVRPDVKYQPNSYIQGWFTGMTYVEAVRRVVAAGKPVTGENLAAVIDTIKDWDTGGVTGKVTFTSHKAGVGRVYKANAAKGLFEPASDWIYVK
ncbi:MAG TPA: ABC transporter substrate-binding protein [Anaeromyxobacteraceae bacterium]|nr:ABC transporter substrate-binding protein [Anaeromyxobacteraceae bacterium]